MHMGEALISSSPFLLAPPETEKRRIVVTGTGSSSIEAIEGCALIHKRKVPPPTRREAVNLSEEEDSLSEAPWHVFFEEEPPIGMTSRSTRGC